VANFQNGAPFCAPPPSNLIARWRGENNAADETGLNNGTLVGGSAFAAGRVGRSVMFNGNSSRKITVPNSASLALTQSMTFEGWLKFDSVSTTANNNLIARKDDGANATAYNLIINNAGKLGFFVAPTRGTFAGHGIEAPQALVANRFYHFAVTVDNATDKYTMYINGAQVGQLATSARPFQNLDSALNPRIEIGGSSYNGLIDELSVYNRALSTSEVATLYTAGSAGVCTTSMAAHRLDRTFGNGGKVVLSALTSNYTSPTIPYDSAYSTVIQPDGKIVVAGSGGGGTGTTDFVVARYNQDGSFDTTFGTGGKVQTPIGNGGDFANAVALQSDGKIVAAGYTFLNSSGDGFALARYNQDGTLDGTFGSGGKVLSVIGSSLGSSSSVAVQSDGKIIVSGSASSSKVLARYNSDGSPDTTFGTNGVLAVPVAGKVALQTDNKIVIGGSVISGSTSQMALARYNSDGSPDTTFGTNGLAATSVGTANSSAVSFAIQADGKIVAAGFASNGSNNDFALARFDANGALDTTYGTEGKVLTPIGNSGEIVRSATIQSDGKIVAVGESYNGSYNSFAAARYNPNGVLDTTFGTGGKIVTPMGNSNSLARSAAIQSNGKIVVAGESYVEISGLSRIVFTLVRYNADAPGTINPETNITINFGNSAQGSTIVTPLTSSQLPAAPGSFAFTSSTQAFEISTSVAFSGSITITFDVPDVADTSACGNLRLLHFVNGAWTSDGNSAPSYNAASQVCTLTQTVTSLSPFAVAQMLAPTAASVSVGGRVLTGKRGIRNVHVTMTDAGGNVRTAITGAFGHYRFTYVPAGATYVFSVSAKNYTFSQREQVRSITVDRDDIDFIGDR
ncbi:MAG TPA: LamG-like jellyroll fold domain-containing protein, partial [Pyrinomonadaceae bacterium]|nr:LamG-like jellyroll fold domain-containing protein [Pyrinomonadaceae bacterium]